MTRGPRHAIVAAIALTIFGGTAGRASEIVNHSVMGETVHAVCYSADETPCRDVSVFRLAPGQMRRVETSACDHRGCRCVWFGGNDADGRAARAYAAACGARYYCTAGAGLGRRCAPDRLSALDGAIETALDRAVSDAEFGVPMPSLGWNQTYYCPFRVTVSKRRPTPSEAPAACLGGDKSREGFSPSATALLHSQVRLSAGGDACLAVRASGLVGMQPCSARGAAVWNLHANGLIRLASDGRCLSIDRADTAPGARLSVFSCHGDPHQVWTLEAGKLSSHLGRCAGTDARRSTAMMKPCSSGDQWRVLSRAPDRTR